MILIEASPSADPRSRLAWGNATHTRGGDRRRCDPHPHPCDGGIARQARRLDVGRMTRAGDILGPRPLQAAPEPVLTAVAPDRDGLVVAVAGLCPG